MTECKQEHHLFWDVQLMIIIAEKSLIISDEVLIMSMIKDLKLHSGCCLEDAAEASGPVFRPAGLR